MQQNASALAKSFAPKVLNPARSQIQAVSSPCGVFISHRGIDTRRNLAGLLHDHLARLRLGPFLDCRNMKPGDRLYDKIDAAIRDCNLGIALFSPRYCDSYFCLRELASLMESNKRVIPIFCDVKPSQLRVKNSVTSSEKELQRFSWALEEAKYTVGLSFDSLRGYSSILPLHCLTGLFNQLNKYFTYSDIWLLE